MAELTENKNYLAPGAFKLTLDSSRFANTEYFSTTWNHPNISMGSVAAPYKKFQNFEPGDRLEFGTLEFQFNVDENIENYKEMYDWMIYNRDNIVPIKIDAIVHVMSSHNNVIAQIKYVDAFPISLGALAFDASLTDVEYIKCDMSLQYSYFEFL